MSTSTTGLLARIWHSWKGLRLPWRRKRLAGSDLNGITYWEFKDQLNSKRMRRMAKHPRKTQLSDVHVSPQWMQWLRHTRQHAPSLQEQYSDVQRQIQLKHLAKLADERWAAKGSLLDKPEQTAQPAPATLPRDPGGYVGGSRDDVMEDTGVANKSYPREKEEKPVEEEDAKAKAGRENPWKRQKGAPSEGWQPEAWKPGPASNVRTK